MNKHISILTVEDSLTQALQLQYILEKAGYQVSVAGNGQEAFTLLEGGLMPTIVISDIMMPLMDGYEFCKRLRADGRFKHLPVILVTTLSNPEDVIKGLECGADTFIVKPYEEKFLLNRIQYLLLNFEIRKSVKAEMGINVFFAGSNYFITAERLQILDLLLSTYESAYHQNVALVEAQNELKNLNERLEKLVLERTAELVDANEKIQLQLQERINAEETLWTLSARYQAILAAVPDIIMETDVHKVYRWANQSGFEFFGDDVLGKEALDYFVGEQDTYDKVSSLFTGSENAIYIESWQVRRDGEKRLLAWQSRVLQDAEGSMTGTLFTARDITESRQAEAEISRLKNQYEMLLHAVGEGIIGEDMEGKIIFANPAAERMFGYSVNELIGRSGHTTWHHAKRDGAPYPKDECPIIRACRDGLPQSGIDEVLWKKDGTSFPAEYLATPIREGDAVIGIVIIFRDITQQKMLREAEVARIGAEAANKTKSEFLANMSHELRTPLNSVIGFSEVLQDEMFGPMNETQHEYVDNIRTSGRHLLSLISDILDLSKVEAGKMEIKLGRFRLDVLLQSSLVMLQEKAMKHTIALNLAIAPDAAIEIESDERKLKQIIYNLLSNAVKFTPDGGTATLMAQWVLDCGGENDAPLQKKTDCIEISVTDTGHGIRPEDLKKLFKPFSQLESPYSKNYEGTGLGLVLVQSMVHLLGGRIWVESEQGKGSRFSFVIPIRSRSQPE